MWELISIPLPHRKCTIHKWTNGPASTCLNVSSRLICIWMTYYRRRQMDRMSEGEKVNPFFQSQHSIRWGWSDTEIVLYRALAEWSALQQQDLCHLRDAGGYDTVLNHLLEAAAAKVLLWLWVQFPGGLSLHMYYPLCPWAGHYLSSPSGGIWLNVNGWPMCLES